MLLITIINSLQYSFKTIIHWYTLSYTKSYFLTLLVEPKA